MLNQLRKLAAGSPPHPEKPGVFIHYIPPEAIEDVKREGLKGVGQLYKEDPEAYLERLKTYARFQDKENPTPEEIIEGIRRFREQPHGENAIFGYPHMVDLEKSKRLKKWLKGKVPVKVNVEEAILAGIIEGVADLNAPPVDYSKVKDKGPALIGIPHPMLIPRTGRNLPDSGRIPSRFLEIMEGFEKQSMLDGIRKVMYHGSPRLLEEISLRDEHGDPDVPLVVFGTPSRKFAEELRKLYGVLEKTAAYSEGGSFTHDGARYSLREAFRVANTKPTRQVRVDDLKWVLAYDRPDPKRLRAADLSAPILVVPDRRGRPTAVDGLHRLSKAVREGRRTLPAKKLRLSELTKVASRTFTDNDVTYDVEKLWGTEGKVRRVSPDRLLRATGRTWGHGSGKYGWRDVLADPKKYPGETERIRDADLRYPLAYLGERWGDRDINQNLHYSDDSNAPDRESTITLREMRPNAFDRIYKNKAGYLYHLDSDAFHGTNRGGDDYWEQISEKPLTPLKVEKIDNVLRALEDAGVEMLPYDKDETIKIIKSESIRKRLAAMTPKARAQYIRWMSEGAPEELLSTINSLREIEERYEENLKKQSMLGGIRKVAQSGNADYRAGGANAPWGDGY